MVQTEDGFLATVLAVHEVFTPNAANVSDIMIQRTITLLSPLSPKCKACLVFPILPSEKNRGAKDSRSPHPFLDPGKRDDGHHSRNKRGEEGAVVKAVRGDSTR